MLPLIKIIQQLSEDFRFSHVVNLDGGQELASDGRHWRNAMESEVDYFFGREKGKANPWNVHIVNLKNLSQDHAPMLLCALLEMFAEVLFQRGQDKTFPTVLLLEEAHHYLRLTNERDILALRHAMENGNEHTLRQISGLPRGDAIAFGSAFNLPVRLSIHEAIPGPRSSDASFSTEWKSAVPI